MTFPSGSVSVRLLETLTFPFLPVAASIVFTCLILAPRVPVFVVILMVLLSLDRKSVV